MICTPDNANSFNGSPTFLSIRNDFRNHCFLRVPVCAMVIVQQISTMVSRIGENNYNHLSSLQIKLKHRKYSLKCNIIFTVCCHATLNAYAGLLFGSTLYLNIRQRFRCMSENKKRIEQFYFLFTTFTFELIVFTLTKKAGYNENCRDAYECCSADNAKHYTKTCVNKN